jgi:hypothetical protein
VAERPADRPGMILDQDGCHCPDRGVLVSTVIPIPVAA